MVGVVSGPLTAIKNSLGQWAAYWTTILVFLVFHSYLKVELTLQLMVGMVLKIMNLILNVEIQYVSDLLPPLWELGEGHFSTRLTTG